MFLIKKTLHPSYLKKLTKFRTLPHVVKRNNSAPKEETKNLLTYNFHECCENLINLQINLEFQASFAYMSMVSLLIF